MTRESNYQKLTNAHHEFAPGLSRYVHLKISNVALGDDLVQATFMKTWLYLQQTGKIDLMRAFLYHMLNNLIIDEYRKKKVMSLELLAESGCEVSAFNSENMPDAIVNVIDGKTLVALIEKLPEKYRSAITMRYLQDLSLKEMSVITRTSKNTVSVQVHRGLAKLKVLSGAGA